MRDYEIRPRVQVEDEAHLLRRACGRYDRDAYPGAGNEEIQSVADALAELTHLGDPFHPDGPRPALCCGVEILECAARSVCDAERPRWQRRDA